MDSGREGMRVSFALFQLNYTPDTRMHKTNGTDEQLRCFWKPGSLDGA